MNKPLSVLIVEDSQEDTALISRLLRRAGYDLICQRVETRDDMSIALDEYKWDVVLSDYEMPRFSAPMALSVMKAKGIDTPLIVVSGVLMEENANAVMQAGARDFIPKSKLARLCAALERELESADVREARRSAEKAQKASEEQYRLLLDSTAEGIFGMDPAGNLTFVNAAGAELLGWKDAEELVGKPLSDIYRPAHADGSQYSPDESPICRAFHNEEKIQHEDELFRRADGTSFPVDYWARPIYRAGEIAGAVVTFRNIAKRKQAEDNFRQLAENIHEVFWMMNAQGTEILYISPGYELIWNRTCESLYREPMSWLEAIHPDDRQKAHEMFLKQLEGEPIDSEYRIQRPDGSERWIRDRAFPIRDESGKLIRVAGIAEDVTERRRTQEALRLSESKFRRLAESNIIGVMVGDFNGHIFEANDAGLDMVRHMREDLEAGRVRWDVFLAPESSLAPEEIIRQLRTDGVVQPFEAEFVGKDGARVPALAGAAVLEGVEERAIAFMLDLTDLKRAEAAQSLLASIVHSSNDAIVGRNMEGAIVSWNKAAERLYGHSAEEAVGMPISKLIPPDRASEPTSIFEALDRGESVQQYETVRLRRDGAPVDVSMTVSPIRDAAGKLMGVSAISRDMTARKQAEAALRDAKEAAEVANRAKSEFLANMSHELRTPMNGLIGMTDLVLDTDLTSEQRELLGLAKSSAESLFAIINDILDFSKIETGRLKLDVGEFSLLKCIDEMSDRFGAGARAKGLHLSCNVPSGVPAGLIGDSGRLRQIIGSLLGNAVKFTERGEVGLDVTVQSCDSDGVEVHFMVWDTGIGIPVDKRQSVFEAFSQVEGSLRRRFGGTGLGLTIAAGLVAMMRGRIWVESEEGQGSRFHFTARFGWA